MKYIEYLIRLLTFKKYPLFRTVPFKQVLLNILMIGILLSIPNIINQYNTTAAMEQIALVQDEFPNFEIKNHQYVGEDKVINSKNIKIKFTNSNKIDSDYDVMFLKDGILIRNFENHTIPYTNFQEITDDDSLKSYVNSHSKNQTFLIIVYGTFQILVLASFAFILLLILSFILDFLSKLMHRKSDYMNWLKIESFIFLVMTVVYSFVSFVFHSNSFIIYVLVLPFLIYYYLKLPLKKVK